MTDINLKSKLFGAMNSYSGFRCNFDKIFNPADYEKLYLLKGGPGTGKSSLMKKLSSYFDGKGYRISEIYCSSDTSSLDGLIIESALAKVGIFDATAPHEYDMKLPGAADEIINLGACWESCVLEMEREKIERLTTVKKRHYRAAYSYLKLAGDFAAAEKEILLKAFDKNALLKNHAGLLPTTTVKGKRREIPISAFCRDGYVIRDSFAPLFKGTISVSNKYGSGLIIMNTILDWLSARSTELNYSPYVLNPEDCDCIFIHDSQTLIKISSGGIECLDCFNLNDDAIEELDRLEARRLEYEELSKNELSAASVAHFALEEIYTPSMDFGMVNKILERIIQKFESVLK